VRLARNLRATSATDKFLSVLDDEGVDEALSFALASGNVPTEDVRTILRYGAFDYDTKDDNYSELSTERLDEILDALGLTKD
jgi:hypothetical protein